MRNLLIFFAAFLPALASNLLTYNIYERTDRVDIMLSFDAPYEGNIFQKREKDTTSLILNSLSYEQSVSKSINSKIVQEMMIEPKPNSLVLSLLSQEGIIVNASKTTDGFGLRIRVTPSVSPAQAASLPQASASIQPAPSPSPAQSLVELDARYFIVLGVLVALLLFLYVFKRYITRKTEDFKDFEPIVSLSGATMNEPTPSQTKSMSWLLKNQNNDVTIIYEKPLDRVNKLVLLSYENRRYLVLTGSSNVLLDSFGQEKIESEKDFEVFFDENKKKLNTFVEERKNSLKNYKDKMSLE